MHIYTAVITSGPTGTAYREAAALMARAVPGYVDHWGIGVTFEGRLAGLGLTEAGTVGRRRWRSRSFPRPSRSVWYRPSS
jgi:hypothetical protein